LPERPIRTHGHNNFIVFFHAFSSII
jgi:hypothetical protein